MPRKPIAQVVANAFGRPALRISAYDGSAAGPTDASVSIHLASPAALSYLITAPSSLGLARAFVSGELEITGDLYDALSMLWSERIGQLSWADRLDVLRNLDPKALRWVEPPSEEFGGCSTASGTPRPATLRRSATTTTCPTPSTSGCSGRR
jgi:cyclopropane-fatty-acyl-phospholipid synthase